jgi:hypothetical protein
MDFKNSLKKFTLEESEKWFLEHGYIYNELYGWEKPEILERFGLEPNMTGVPCRYSDDVVEETKWEDERDDRGNKTGRKVARFTSKFSGKKKLVIDQNWLNYQDFKHL